MTDEGTPPASAAGKRKRDGAAKAAAAAKVAAGPHKNAPKTAVVVIHGMGEPTPLQTITSFVDTVYSQDESLAPPMAKMPLDISIAPDSATGSSELRRITTHADGPKKRTDFFEFYWADIMDGTPVEMVTAWIQMLLLRAPWRVPKSVRVFSAWIILWVLFLIVVTAALVTIYPNLYTFIPFVPEFAAWFGSMRGNIGVAIVWLGVLWFLISLVLSMFGSNRTIRRVKLSGPLVLLVIGALLVYLPTSIADEPRVWAAAITAGMGWFMNFLVAPYLGDVVRYVRATPSTVERRRLVRERGMALLEAIHAKRLDDEDLWRHTEAETDNRPYYDRVVIVGHSLGSIVAYDLVQLFWEKHGPTHHQDWLATNTKVQAALKACDAFVKDECGTPPLRPFRLDEFHTAQKDLQDVIRDERPHWRITDLITLGSPLAHAEFLLADSVDEVRKAFDERRFATSPPHPDPILGPTMLYPGKGTETLYPHFAAQFAAVKWTNIHDHSHVPLLGDLISGSLTWLFGPGIDEHKVAIKRPHRPWILRRIFTHTQYWTWDDSYVADEAQRTNAAAPGLTLPERRKELWHNVPEHIRRLRLALRLEG
jgi:hypothetical protein